MDNLGTRFAIGAIPRDYVEICSGLIVRKEGLTARIHVIATAPFRKVLTRFIELTASTWDGKWFTWSV